MTRNALWTWTHEQQLLVHAMWERGEKVAVIIATIGCPKASFETYRRARLAPRGSGGRPPGAYTDIGDAKARDARIRHMLSNNATIADIGRAFGLDREKTMRLIERIKREDKRKLTHTVRACLRCRRPFESAGKHNRLCGDCGEYARLHSHLTTHGIAR
jgi:hypothetical protein